MSVASSTYSTDDGVQSGGGRWTTERHTDADGTVYVVGPYLWDGVTDRASLMAGHAADIDLALAEAEANEILT